MEKRLAAIAAGQDSLVTRRQSLSAGLGPAALQWRLGRGDLEPVYQGVYRVAGTRRTVEQAILAACLAAGQGAVASHATAAELHGLPAGGSGTHVTVPWNRRTRVEGLTLHRVARLDRVDTVVKRGVPVTSVARTIIDLAAELRPERLEEVLDHALAARMVSLEQLRYRLSSLGTRGRLGAGALAGLVSIRQKGSPRPRERGERGLEQILVEHGLPVWETQNADGVAAVIQQTLAGRGEVAV